jgi:hypothetical protein
MVEWYELAQAITRHTDSVESPIVSDKFKRAQDFRSRAEGLREIARSLTRDSERELLMQVAEEYDVMARSAAATGKFEVEQAFGNSEEELDAGFQTRRKWS